VRGIELSGEDGSGRGRQRGFVCHDWVSKDEMTRWITELRSDCQSKSISSFERRRQMRSARVEVRTEGAGEPDPVEEPVLR
jgi:hypothetical protein